MIEFIFMLTRDDETLADAREVYASIAETGVSHVGCKEVGRVPVAIRVAPGDDRDDITMWLALNRGMVHWMGCPRGEPSWIRCIRWIRRT